MSRRVAVSDHALVRWLARTGAMDIEALRDLLAASLERASAAAARLEAGEYLILADGMVFVVRQGVVVTCLREDERHRHVRGRLDRLEPAPVR